MFFFIAGNSKKHMGTETVKVSRNNMIAEAQVKIYRNHITIFFLPLIPLGKQYSIYIPQTGEYYENSVFSKMPPELLEICKQAGRNY